MNRDPHGVDGRHECALFFVWDDHSCVPTSTSIDHVEDDILVHEKEVTLYLLIELVRNVHATGVARSGLRPCPANAASVYYLWYKVQDLLRYSYSLQEPLHRVL